MKNYAEQRYSGIDPFMLYGIGKNDYKNQNVLVVNDLVAALVMSRYNKVVYITADEESYDLFNKNVVYNPCFGKDATSYLIQQDWVSELNDITAELANDMRKKFACCMIYEPQEEGLGDKILGQVGHFQERLFIKRIVIHLSSMEVSLGGLKYRILRMTTMLYRI